MINWVTLLHTLKVTGDHTERPHPEPADDLEPKKPEIFVEQNVVLDESFTKSIVDLRHKSPKKERRKKRDLSEVVGVALHQTSVQRSSRATARRAHLTVAHVLVSQDGYVFWIHPFEAYLYAADHLNAFTVSVELMGNFQGEPGGRWYKPKRFGEGHPTPIQIHRTRQTLLWLTTVIPSLCWLWAHRQSRVKPKVAKELDPGWEVWQTVSGWAERSGVLETQPWRTWGTGLPIPHSWVNPNLNRSVI